MEKLAKEKIDDCMPWSPESIWAPISGFSLGALGSYSVNRLICSLLRCYSEVFWA